MDIDAFDRALLSVVQEDNRLPNRVIAERVNLSETAVRRRLDRLRASGLIRGDVALLDQDALGQTLIVSVVFGEDTPSNHFEFRTRMMAERCVTQCYSIAGEVDFIIHVHASSLRDFEVWAEQHLLGDPGIRRYETSVVFTTHKFSTAIPVPNRA
ncbi:Lrp/AsnC family transcriptional regulator [Maricaulis sp.]|uniref:Lrp/AsnC family transcriptional regulator n=1 Tax=Maricaulis sp. TaxID=1486257 RepID=UPI002B275A1C|nr:Lrp/AsnC family transcriptional regulator [Maricaulis sp.]